MDQIKKVSAPQKFLFVEKKKMKPIQFFYKELTVDKSNIFTADITEKNEVENVKPENSLAYAVTGLSINRTLVQL